MAKYILKIKARSDPILGSDSFISNNPNQQTPPIRTPDSDLTSPLGLIATTDASHASVGGSSDPKVVPGSDLKVVPGSNPLPGSGDFSVAEGGFKSFEPKRAKRAKKGTEDGGETLGWLPTGWTVISKTRANGATAGIIDKYYIEPTTGQKFRSKNEVKRYLETGSSDKKNCDANTTSFKKTGTRKKNMKGDTRSIDFENL